MPTRRTKEKSRKRRRVSAKEAAKSYASGGRVKYLKIPQGLDQFKPEKGKYRLDFTYYVCGKGNPKANEGDEYMEREFFIHKKVGPNEDWYTCPARTFNKPCPICEYLTKRSKDPDMDEDDFKDLRNEIGAKERRLYLVKDLGEGKDSPWLLYNESAHIFARPLSNKILNAEEEDGYDEFADAENGLTVRVSYKPADKGRWVEVSDLEFRPRKHKYDPDIVDEMPCLDDMIICESYDDLKKAFLGVSDEEEDSDDDEPEKDKPRHRPRKSVGKKKMENDATVEEHGIEVDDVVIYDGEEHTVIKISGDGTSLTLEDEDGDDVRAISPADVKKVKKSSTNNSEDKDDDDDDEPKEADETKAKVPPDDDDDDDDDDNWGDYDDDDD